MPVVRPRRPCPAPGSWPAQARVSAAIRRRLRRAPSCRSCLICNETRAIVSLRGPVRASLGAVRRAQFSADGAAWFV